MAEPPIELQRIERLTPLADALVCIDRLVGPVAPCRLGLGQAIGLTLAEDIVSRYAHPGSAMALRDGVAVDAAATLDASSYAPAPLAGAPAFVDVGDPLPSGTDAVATREMVELGERAARAVAPLAPGDGVLPQGADAVPGDVMGRAGTRLRASDIMCLQVLGITEVAVRQPLVRISVAHRSSDAVLAAISNMLMTRVEAAGARSVQGNSDIICGERTHIMGATSSAVIVVGGSGSGRHDASVSELARPGSVAFHGVALAPGDTAAFGMIDQRPVLIVPGRPDAALAAWLTLGCRMVARLAGRGDDGEVHTPVVLTRKIASTLGLVELVPVRRAGEGVEPLASGYLTLQSLTRADGYVMVPAESEGFAAGATVEMRFLP